MIYPDAKLEKSLWEKGIKYVAGIDEAGRGPWAGPVVAGIVIIKNENQCVVGVNDSKKISKKKREELYNKIVSNSLAYGVGVVENIEIDNIGLAQAVKKAMELAIVDCETRFGNRIDYLIIDGKSVKSPGNYQCYKVDKGDSLHYSIASASIIAKVYRDRLMGNFSKMYPEYMFEENVGYGTKKHRDAISKYGLCEIHRRSFKPIANIINSARQEEKGNWKYWRACS